MQILIVPLINGKEHGDIIQKKAFVFSLKISNESDTPSSGFNIKNIKFSSDKNQDLHANFSEEFHVEILNPRESKIIKVGEDGLIISGLTSLKADVRADDSTTTIDVVQKNQITGEISKNTSHQFIDFLYIRSLNEVKQEKSTNWMIILTIVIGTLAIVQLALPFLKLIKTT